jgi:hypothetical protein
MLAIAVKTLVILIEKNIDKCFQSITIYLSV